MTPLMVTVPAESVPPVPPPLVVPKGARTATSPVGVPVAGATGLTVTVAVTAVPWVIGAGAKLPLMVNVLAVALKLPTAVPQAPITHGTADRKSTRLNSSHVA